jgi:hypothetical protein
VVAVAGSRADRPTRREKGEEKSSVKSRRGEVRVARGEKWVTENKERVVKNENVK